ncbi:MAG: SAM-dependent methyltransferase [Micavibrio sp.]|nr:SAM-dependent methyltransferase [Micavibrio sp.]|tara:strand:- start:1007 stop:2296 length:1290 start_codon:yes stop_codon:yes gene_type:complete
MSSCGTTFTCDVDFILKSEECIQAFLKFCKQSKTKYKPSRSMALALKLMTRLHNGTLDVTLPNGKTVRFKGEEDGPTARISIHNDRVVNRFISQGKLGFCEAYLDGDWTSPDLTAFFEIILKNESYLIHMLEGSTWYRRLSWLIHKFRPNSKKGASKNIYRHYDLGNHFYSQWLDKSMTYSSAVFKSGKETLEEAQAQKYRLMCERLDLQENHHLLEIGCGWGGMAEYAAKNIGCKVTAITISPSQYDYAKKRIDEANLQHLVEIKLCDYRDIKGKYDRIASIEMFEAVGEAYWPVFFETIKKKLKKNGLANLQIITIEEESYDSYKSTADFIQRYIFPGGMLPCQSVLERQIEGSGLEISNHVSFGKDYAKTLHIWHQAFQEKWPDLQGGAKDERFKKLWEEYLCYCEAGFKVGTIDVIQISMKNVGR